MWSGVDLNQKFDIFYTCDLDQTWVRCLTSSTPVIWTRLESEVLHHLHLWSGSDLNQNFDIIYTCDLGQMWIKHLMSFTLVICTRHESDIYCHIHQWPGPLECLLSIDITQNNSFVCREVYRPCTSRVFKILERHQMTHNGKWAALSPSPEQGRAQFTSSQGRPSIKTESHVQHGSSCQCKCPQCSIYPRIYFMHYALLC